MVRNSPKSSGFMRARNLVRRLRTFFMALVLALVIGSVGQTVPVSAQIPVLEYSYRVSVPDPPRKICVGETKKFEASIREIVAPGSNKPGGEADLPLPQGSGITASVDHAEYAELTGLRTKMVSGPDAGSWATGIFSFMVKGKKAGGALITFTANFPAQPAWVPVQVANCPIDVQAISYFFKQLGSATVVIKAVTQQAKVTAAENTNSYLGEATVLWFASTRHLPPGCAATDTITTGKVSISGTADDNTGALHLDLFYDPVNYSELIPCSFSSGKGSSKGQISTTSINVTVPGSGGMSSAHQDVSLEGKTVGGQVDVYVVPSQEGTGP